MTASYLPLQPLAEALIAVLSVDSTLRGLVGDGWIGTDLPQDARFPCLWIEMWNGQQFGGMGTRPGNGALPELTVRFHVFSTYRGWTEANGILARVLALVSAPGALTVAGYAVCGNEGFHDAATPLDDQEMNGVKCKELVSEHRWYLEEAA